jgi:hypothetical protein
MKKIVFIFLLFPFFIFANERISLSGNVFDGVTFFPIANANIYNFSSKQYCFTDKVGNFDILVKEGDTLIVSKPIYKQDIIIITADIFEKKFVDIPIYYKVILLKEVNVFALPSSFDEFKKEFLNTNLSDYYKVLEGTALSKEDRIGYGNNNLLDLIPGEVGKAVTSPISYLYDKFSRKMKMERLYREIVDNQKEVDNLPLKYNRDIVSSLTGLKGEELLDFMTYCKFSYYNLIRWSPEYIITQIQNTFDDYEFYKAIQDN